MREDPRGGAAPDISVVVIVYNDERRLPAAVRSVLGQTLRNVEVVIADDHSTDGSFEVARRLEAESDRVRAIRLPENSGGCGEPRNQGVAVARGRYVMFLDSDDTLEPNACRNMLEAAESTGADLVSGLCLRVHVDSRWGTTSKWYPWLYRRTRTLESIAELPDLLVFDTLSTNKCYRRAWLVERGLTFPRGIHYEDLLFSARAYLAASRITLIPDTVYHWNVVRKAEAKSISNRRHEINNFADRLEIHRRIDRILAAGGHDALKLHKDRKFLKHDLVLYLRELPFLDDDYRRRFAGMANGYLREFPEEAYEELSPVHRLCAYLLLREDWEHLMQAVDTLINKDKVSSPLAERDGRVYWCEEHLDDPLGRAVLDVTGLGYHQRPLSRLFLRNAVTGYAGSPGGVTLSGAVVNPLGAIRPGARLTAELEFRARRRSLRSFRFPVRTVRHAGPSVVWEATVPLARKLRPVGVLDDVWDVRMHLTVDGERTTSRLTVGGTDLEGPGADAVRVRPVLSRLAADRLEPRASSHGHLAFHLVQRGALSRRAVGVLRHHLESPPTRLTKKALRTALALRKELVSGRRKIEAYHRMIRLLPVRRGTVVFESHLGRQYSDSPRAVHEELRRRNIPVRAVWSYAGAVPTGFPEDAELVRRWSWRYIAELARAEFWIDNQGFPLKLAKRPETTYIQTWHGSALKRMGFDTPQMRVLPERERLAYQRAVDRFDHFVVRGRHDELTLARAYRIPPEKLLRTGYPRNDALVRARESGVPDPAAEELAERLGVRRDLPVVLYAPTFRAREGGGVEDFAFPFDIDEFAGRFGDELTLLVRTHYLNGVTLPPSVAGRVVDVSGEPDITPVLLLADVLVTDYSSVMFDYALLQRPMVFFTYDWDDYVHNGRGTYFDLSEEAPGPVVHTAEELFEALSDLDRLDGHKARLKEFTTRYGEYDQGDAAARIVDRFFGARGGDR
ncbi:bifunctional glycosyltransferase/CDP-glycerol:glycerophosphate glycerophosphotransferase [Streptomyces abyssomicinicus]|uniref:bifunctional glycosyltransferase/CDP-glycerol:glycerophosphate glycerophosphotransferase n=1 Tax=Streptomyces abyssomicinicus TaxID=574929 RepID=UPI001250469E|nr:CDP-glycerol glycerophosphotransferase family protein [Streptomyces abyssomicinicus]